MIAARSTVYGFRKNPTMVDYPGRLAALFFVTGCNFRCGYCHNASLLGTRREGLTFDRLENACEKFRDHWVDAVVISGGEPTLSPDLPVLVGLFRSFGFKVKLDTNGSRPEVLERLLSDIDYVAMDVKCTLARYPELAGFADPDRIGRSIGLIRDMARDYEFRTTVVEAIHSDAEMLDMADTIRGARRYVLQPFVPHDDLPDLRYRTMPRTSPDRMKQVEKLVGGCADEIVCRG